MMVVKLQDTLIYARGLRADRAAAYLGMGKTKFLELVDNCRMPKAVIIDGMKLVPEAEQSELNSFDKILKLDK
jgi:hypothetical protein